MFLVPKSRALILGKTSDIFVEAAEKMLEKILQAIFLLSLVSFTYSFPLSTKKRWIINGATGQRVKLACVNWPAHLQPMLAEGLDKKPLREIVAAVAQMHFNCVRLTWSTFMFTRPNYGKISVSQTLDSLGLKEAKQGIAENNPFILNMTHIQAYEAVVGELGAQGIMALLDNHISKPGWCCSNADGNGFFGDLYFDPNEWMKGLSLVADRFKGKHQVVAISLRNELRGPRQNEPDWRKYISEGAMVVHKRNPDVLVFVSGLNFDLDLSFLQKRPLALDLDKKLVYEIHWYAFSQDQNMWKTQPTNRVCNKVTQSFINRAAFLTTRKNPAPLLLSEFGFDQREVNLAGNLYMTCLIAYAAETDLDWALWALQGSYYVRKGLKGTEETFGALDSTWQHPRNPNFLERLRFLQTKTHDPTKSRSGTSYIIFHPLSGNCVNANVRNELYASNRSPFSRWSYDGDGAPIRLMDSSLCLKAVGDGLPPMLSNDCHSKQSEWSLVSRSKLHLATKDDEHGGELLCLQVSPTNSSQVVTTKCICIGDDSSCLQVPQSQWFKLVLSNVLSLA